MSSQIPESLVISEEIRIALAENSSVVALETTVITHGLPFPENIQLARDMENQVRRYGSVPASIAVLDGLVHVGLSMDQVDRLAQMQEVHKISSRDYGLAVAMGWSGGTTVAGSILVANKIGIKVFATGGIGGVHLGSSADISADLIQLSKSPLIVVSAGAKAILDLPATLEYLETVSVPVIGYQTEYLPAFYSRSCGLKVDGRADTPSDIVQIAQAHWSMGMESALLVTVPPPEHLALPYEDVEDAIEQALLEMNASGIIGKDVTPYLLERVSKITAGSSLAANLGLLLNNARVASEISKDLASNPA